MTRVVVDALEFQATAEVRDGSLQGFRRLDQDPTPETVTLRGIDVQNMAE